jgi:hypothetical protein
MGATKAAKQRAPRGQCPPEETRLIVELTLLPAKIEGAD